MFAGSPGKDGVDSRTALFIESVQAIPAIVEYWEVEHENISMYLHPNISERNVDGNGIR